MKTRTKGPPTLARYWCYDCDKLLCRTRVLNDHSPAHEIVDLDADGLPPEPTKHEWVLRESALPDGSRVFDVVCKVGITFYCQDEAHARALLTAILQSEAVRVMP